MHCPRKCIALAAALAWLPPHGLLGVHWLVIGLSRRVERRQCLLHFLAALVGFALLAAGGWYSRFGGEYTTCQNNATMHQRCMWSEQRAGFAAVYVLHFMGGTYCIAAWVCDGLALPGLSRGLTNDTALCLLYSRRALWPGYSTIVGLSTLLTCVVWFAMPWSTHPQKESGELDVQTLALVMIGVSAAVPILVILVLQGERRRPTSNPAK